MADIVHMPLYELTGYSENVIPEGIYCYTRDANNNVTRCPYWSTIRSYPKQMNGFCEYLGMGDWNFTYEDMEGNVIGHMHGLLWDQCKECHVKWDWPDDIEEIEK